MVFLCYKEQGPVLFTPWTSCEYPCNHKQLKNLQFTICFLYSIWSPPFCSIESFKQRGQRSLDRWLTYIKIFKLEFFKILIWRQKIFCVVRISSTNLVRKIYGDSYVICYALTNSWANRSKKNLKLIDYHYCELCSVIAFFPLCYSMNWKAVKWIYH